MTDLLLVFLGVAYLENLLLWVFLDGGLRAASGIAGKWLRVAGSLLMLALLLHLFPTTVLAIPPQGVAYLHALAFVATAMAIAPGAEAPALVWDLPRLRLLRMGLPLLVANLAVMVFVLLDGQRSASLRDTLGFCLGASLAFSLAMLFVPPLRERIEGASVPRSWQGLPILTLTAGLVALALTGYRDGLPW